MRILLIIATALGVATGVAQARPQRVVVLRFEGPEELAREGRRATLAALDRYDIVPLKKWKEALATEQLVRPRGAPPRWPLIAKATHVHTIIEGWVADEGKQHVLTVSVIDAATQKEVDSISVRITVRGLTDSAMDEFADELDELMQWND